MLQFEISVICRIRVGAVVGPLAPAHARVPGHFNKHALGGDRLDQVQGYFAPEHVSLRKGPLLVHRLAGER